MKRLTFIVAFLCVFYSCTKDSVETVTTDYHGKWALIKMSGSIPNSEALGADMEWQEFYLFKNDGTFTKSRVRNEVKTTFSGTYTIKNSPNTRYLELTYPNDNETIGNCTGDLIEDLCFTANNTLSSTWSACDGPGLEYQKVD
jgi:hypothetical protein